MIPTPHTPDGGSQADDGFEDHFDMSKHLQDLLLEPLPDARHPVDAGETRRLRTELTEIHLRLVERDSYIEQ